MVKVAVSVLAVVGLSVLILLAPPSPESASAAPVGTGGAASKPQLAHTKATNGWVDPGWKKIPDLQAHWLRPLNRDNIYWTTAASNGVTNPVGSVTTVLSESYGWSGDTYKTRPTMEFSRTSPGGSSGNITGPLMFSSQAMGVYGDPPADSSGQQPLTVYFWSHDGSNNQTYISNSNIPSGYIPVIRTTSGAANDTYSDIYVGVMPAPGTRTGDSANGWSHGPGAGPVAGVDLSSTGGEVSQVTGYLYTSTRPYTEIDNTALISTAPTQSASQYCIWDPFTGNYSLSHMVQPGDWSPGMTKPSMDRWALRRDVGDTSTGPVDQAGRPQSVATGSTTASADMGLDALGNAYLYYGGDAVPASGLGYNAGIAKIAPARSATGDILDGSPNNPWRYTNVTKVRSQLGESWSGAGNAWGVGIRNGKFLIGTSITTYPGPGESIPGTSGTQSRLVSIDPLSGLGKIMGSSDNAQGRNNNTYYVPATNTSYDMASPQGLMVIQGSVYNDVDGNGSSASDGGRPTNATGLPKQTLALYDSNKRFLGSTVTSALGAYSFIVASTGKYYVRAVQPGVPQPDGTVIAAHQTWGASTSGSIGSGDALKTNVSTMRCLTGGISNPAGRAADTCQGALQAPYPDKNIETLGQMGNEADWPFYGTVDIQTGAIIPVLDFGFSNQGSYGDASNPPYYSTNAQKGPVLQSADQNDLKLGEHLGFYGDGTNDSLANKHTTDDGVTIKFGDGTVAPLQGSAFVRGRSYDLNLNVGGRLAANSHVSVWQRNADGTAAAGPATSDAVAGDNIVSISMPAGSGAIAKRQIRAMVTPKSFTPAVDDTGGGFARHPAGAASNNTAAWTVPGEVEDYGVYLAGALVRLQVKVNNGTVPAAPFKYALTNVDEGDGAADNPSSSTDSITVSGIGQATTSATVHAVTDATAGNKGVKITDVTNKATLGSEYSISSITCHGTTDNANFPTVVSANEGTATVSGISSGADVTCRVEYDNHARFLIPKTGVVAVRYQTGTALLLLSVSGLVAMQLRKRFSAKRSSNARHI